MDPRTEKKKIDKKKRDYFQEGGGRACSADDGTVVNMLRIDSGMFSVCMYVCMCD